MQKEAGFLTKAGPEMGAGSMTVAAMEMADMKVWAQRS
jgi:hypothetical protein